MALIRPLEATDLAAVIEVYHDAVCSQAPALYSASQVRAWAGHAAATLDLEASLLRGKGLVSCGHAESTSSIEAFALLDPMDRLALLYCRGRSSRQGRATALLHGLEAQAARSGVSLLRTEASQLSRPLLLRHGWRIEAPEDVLFAGEWFHRWRMVKSLPVIP